MEHTLRESRFSEVVLILLLTFMFCVVILWYSSLVIASKQLSPDELCCSNFCNFHTIYCLPFSFCIVLYSIMIVFLLIYFFSFRIFNTFPQVYWVNRSFCFSFKRNTVLFNFLVDCDSSTGLSDFYWIVDCFEKWKSRIAPRKFYFVLFWLWVASRYWFLTFKLFAAHFHVYG